VVVSSADPDSRKLSSDLESVLESALASAQESARESARIAPRLGVGDDGSLAADRVWLWVNNHHWPGWRISVVTARAPENWQPDGAERAILRPWAPPHPRRLLTGDEVEVEHLFAETDPRLALDSCADAAIVAVGPRGNSLLKYLHIGSTTEWLISARRPLAPVIVVRSAWETNHVLYCTDGSAHARSALDALLRLPWLRGCRVSVLCVDDGRDIATTKPAVEQAVARLQAHGVDQVTHELIEPDGELRSVILRNIADKAPDLVALGARGTVGIRGWLVGSVTAAVVHQATCSVLVANAG
jgi:nucleotide-binding universal stress UspA family protein